MPKRRSGAKMLRKQWVDEDVWTLALDRTREVYDLWDRDHIIVNFSGGKDSTVVLHAALEVAEEYDALPVKVNFFDEEAIPYETEQYVRRVMETQPVEIRWQCVPYACRTACDPETGDKWWPWAPEAKDLWCRPMPPEGIASHPATDGVAPKQRPGFAEQSDLDYENSALILGIRAEESLTRLQAVIRRTDHNYWSNTTRANVKIYPIYDMRTPDLWSLVRDKGWDHNEAYDLMEMLGIPAQRQRLAPPFGEEPLRRLQDVAAMYPEIWDKMVERVPGADAAARYFTTEIWASNASMELPPGMTWPQFVRYLLEQHEDPTMRASAAKKVEYVINLHRRNTTDPILGTQIHPASGCSWQRIAVMAASGDTMDRKLSSIYAGVTTPTARVKVRKKYEAAIADLSADELAALRP